MNNSEKLVNSFSEEKKSEIYQNFIEKYCNEEIARQALVTKDSILTEKCIMAVFLQGILNAAKGTIIEKTEHSEYVKILYSSLPQKERAEIYQTFIQRFNSEMAASVALKYKDFEATQYFLVARFLDDTRKEAERNMK